MAEDFRHNLADCCSLSRDGFQRRFVRGIEWICGWWGAGESRRPVNLLLVAGGKIGRQRRTAGENAKDGNKQDSLLHPGTKGRTSGAANRYSGRGESISARIRIFFAA